ncbi:uncharacterized protein LOC105261800 [Musca domestica]|uniref:Uncharacterized protein LOC105261800 n=1 Tax=Musca domestica TaxID=7370 RepID=A0A9J7I8Y9_MUSDO|nr:uncharacterized protein LOC105261800 [Musca domestica]
MAFLSYYIVLQFLISSNVFDCIQGAAIICENDSFIKKSNDFGDKFAHNISHIHISVETETNENEVNKFLHKIQCTLEKAKPWMDELQQEAKRLEEAAKLLELGIINSFGAFIDKLTEDEPQKPSHTALNATVAGNGDNSSTTTAGELAITTTTEEISEFLCPEGFIADHNGICERIE